MIGKAYGTHGREEKYRGFLLEMLREKYRLEGGGADGRIDLKLA